MSDLKQLKLCNKLAKIAHYGQYRNDGVTPYIVHPEAVSNSVLTLKAKCVAWLHDVIEDCNVTEQQLVTEGVEKDIIDAVVLLTKANNEDYLKYILRLKKNSLALEVKIADIKHNMSTLNKRKNRDKWAKYQMALYILKKT